MKTIKRNLMIIFFISIPMVLFYLVPIRVTPKVPLEKDDFKLEIRKEAVTGSQYYVEKEKEKAKLKKIIQERYPNEKVNSTYIDFEVNSSYRIDLKGNLPYKIVDDPAYASNKYEIYGNIDSLCGGEDGSLLINVKYTTARVPRINRNDLSYFEGIIICNVFDVAIVALVSAVLLVILFIITVVNKFIKRKKC